MHHTQSNKIFIRLNKLKGLEQENQLIKHENKHIIRYKNHIKEQLDELQLKLICYKDKYKYIYKYKNNCFRSVYWVYCYQYILFIH